MNGRVVPPLAHLQALQVALEHLVADAERIDRLGRQLARAFRRGHRLLAVGNGGSAAQAGHLTAELVGRYVTDRLPLPAITLGADTATLTALGNDFGIAELFARQVRAQGRPGDVLVAFSTSGASENVLAATRTALRLGMRTVGFTGRLPNPLASLCCDVVAADAATTATVQEVHQVALHLLCGGIDAELSSAWPQPAAGFARVAAGAAGAVPATVAAVTAVGGPAA